jgi:hypothetical protein
MAMERKNSIIESKRERFLPCNGLAKLHVVFIRCEKYSFKKATPLTSEETGDTI